MQGPFSHFSGAIFFFCWLQIATARSFAALGTLSRGNFNLSDDGDPERIVGNLYRAYSELRGEPLGRPIDPQAFADMVTYNGGQPLRCWA